MRDTRPLKVRGVVGLALGDLGSLILELDGDLAQGVFVLVGVVPAEQQFSAVLEYDADVRSCSAPVAAVGGREILLDEGRGHGLPLHS